MSLFSVQIIPNDVYIQRGREMFCMILRDFSWKDDTFCYPVSCRCNFLWISTKLYRSRPWPIPRHFRVSPRQNTFEAVPRQPAIWWFVLFCSMQWEVSWDDICSNEADRDNHMMTYPQIPVSELIRQGRIWSPFLRRCFCFKVMADKLLDFHRDLPWFWDAWNP